MWCRVIGSLIPKVEAIGCGPFIHSLGVELKYNNILLLQSVVPLPVEFEKATISPFSKPDPIQTKSGFEIFIPFWK